MIFLCSLPFGWFNETEVLLIVTRVVSALDATVVIIVSILKVVVKVDLIFVGVLEIDDDVHSPNCEVVVLFEDNAQSKSIFSHRLLNSSTIES